MIEHLLAGLLDGLEKEAGRAPRAPEYKVLDKHRVALTPGERAYVMDNKAVWHRAWKNGKQVPSPAVWKAVMPDGKVWYVTNTHRVMNARPTVRGAVSRYHKFIKTTA